MSRVSARRSIRHGSRLSVLAPTRNVRLTFQTLEGREVPATGLGIANDFSAFVLHDLHAYTSDVQGRVAVGGNADITAYAVGDQLTNSNSGRDDLIVGGNLTFTNGQVFNGNIVYGGTGTFDHFGHPNGTIRQGTVLDFAAAGAALDALSDSYAALAPTGTVQDWYGNIILTGNNPGQNVFNVPASMLWNAYDLIIKTPAGSTAIVNITGTQARMQFMGFHLEGVTRDSVILNFPQATSLTFQGIGVNANVLAPRALVDFSNGQLNGTLVASSWTGYGQVNYDRPLVPEEPPPCTCPPLPPSQVSGLVYFDKNQDGQAQDDESRLGGVEVTLTGQDEDGNSVAKSTTTDGGGIYQFNDLPAGVYSIEVTTPDGYEPGQSTTGAFGGVPQPNVISQIDIPGGQSSGGYNFGELLPEPPPPPPPPPPSEPPPDDCPPLPPSQVSGLVYFDSNNDGQAQDSEMRFEGVSVLLTGTDLDGNSVSMSATTDAGGIYTFNGIAEGNYSIQATAPSGYVAGQSSTGVFGGLAGPNLISGIVVPGGQSSGGYNFGEITNCSLGM